MCFLSCVGIYKVLSCLLWGVYDLTECGFQAQSCTGHMSRKKGSACWLVWVISYRRKQACRAFSSVLQLFCDPSAYVPAPVHLADKQFHLGCLGNNPKTWKPNLLCQIRPLSVALTIFDLWQVSSCPWLYSTLPSESSPWLQKGWVATEVAHESF